MVVNITLTNNEKRYESGRITFVTDALILWLVTSAGTSGDVLEHILQTGLRSRSWSFAAISVLLAEGEGLQR